jgi:hypothetical protein
MKLRAKIRAKISLMHISFMHKQTAKNVFYLFIFYFINNNDGVYSMKEGKTEIWDKLFLSLHLLFIRA